MLGFSQGAAATALLLSCLASTDLEAQLRPRFAIMVSQRTKGMRKLERSTQSKSARKQRSKSAPCLGVGPIFQHNDGEQRGLRKQAPVESVLVHVAHLITSSAPCSPAAACLVDRWLPAARPCLRSACDRGAAVHPQPVRVRHSRRTGRCTADTLMSSASHCFDSGSGVVQRCSTL